MSTQLKNPSRLQAKKNSTQSTSGIPETAVRISISFQTMLTVGPTRTHILMSSVSDVELIRGHTSDVDSESTNNKYESSNETSFDVYRTGKIELHGVDSWGIAATKN